MKRRKRMEWMLWAVLAAAVAGGLSLIFQKPKK